MKLSFVKNISKSAKAAVVAALALVFWAFGSVDAFFVCAQDKGADARESVLRVYYRLDNAALNPSYMGNAATLETIDSLATVCAANGVSGLEITSFSSLEGNFNYNQKLSERRAKSLWDYIVEMHPLLRNRISTNVQAESWEDLKAAVLADSRFSESEKDEIVAVIESGDEPDSREARLKQLPSYSRLYAIYFKSLRYAEIRFIADPAAVVADNDAAASGSDIAAADNVSAATGSDTAAAGSDTAASGAAGTATAADNAAGVATAGSATDGSAVSAPADSSYARVTSSEAAYADSTDSAAAATTDSTAAATSSTSATPATSAQSAAGKASNKVGVLFPLNGTAVEADHASNRAVFNEIANLLDGRKPEDFESVVVVSGSSIDGTVATNNRISRQRGESLLRWIEENYPEFKGRVTLDSRGEDWEAFRSAVESDSKLDNETRSSILAIADSDDTPEKKEASLRGLSCWDYIKDNILPQTRHASVHATLAAVQAPEPEALPGVEVEDEHLNIDQTRDSLDTAVAPVDTLATPVAPVAAVGRKPILAVSTNALYDLAITPNFAIEVPVGKKVSLYGEYTFPWWVSRDNSRAWQMLKWDIGARYWLFGGRSNNPMDVMIGPFAGIDLGAGYYDIEPHHKGWQGEFQTVGAEIGWAWDLGKNWRLDAFVGAGWMGSHFRAYQGSTDDKHLLYQDSGRLTWFGPTKAGVSFKYIFGHAKHEEEK